MPKQASLVLEDGSVYRGYSFGAERWAYGEVVFNTSMTGYQEMLTDPSYKGQMIVATYPIIGNYGTNEHDSESLHVQASGFIVRELCRRPSHPTNSTPLDKFLVSNGVPGVCGVDTRAITRRLRTRGVMAGIISISESPENALKRLHELPSYNAVDFVKQVSAPSLYRWDKPELGLPESNPKIVVIDYGLKRNILRLLHSRGCEVIVIPATTPAQKILNRRPDGVLLSPGPGDPELLDYAAETTARLIGRVPIMGICLGHQVLARALGGKTFKLKFGHRGSNHPVRDLNTGLVHITSQNHGYAVDSESLSSEVEVSHLNLNDDTVEGLRHKSLPLMSVQYHSEASPGPLDNEYLLDRFLDMVRDRPQ